MSIRKNLNKVHFAVTADITTPAPGGLASDLGKLIGAQAVEAVKGGLSSPEWKKYMALFADNEEQLNFLTTVPKDANGNPVIEPDWIPEGRAYIVANGVCNVDTTTFTAHRVNAQFGAALSEVPDGVPAQFRDAALFDRINKTRWADPARRDRASTF